MSNRRNAAVMSHLATCPNFLPLARQRVDESWGIVVAGSLSHAGMLLEKNTKPQAAKPLPRRHFRVLSRIFLLSRYVHAKFFERRTRVAPAIKRIAIHELRKAKSQKTLKILDARNSLTGE